MTPYDALPLEVRRENWGWFGEPWWSYVCYGEDGRLLEETRKPFPAGEECLYCGEPFDEAAGDSGQAFPCATTEGSSVRHAHKECSLRNVLGSVACLEGRHRHDTGQTRRQEALAVWAWVQEHGVSDDFRRQASGFTERNDDLLRRLADLDALVPRLPAATLRHRVMQPVDRLQFLFGQAMLTRRPVVDGDAIRCHGRVPGGPQVRIQDRRPGGHPALFGEVLDIRDHCANAAVLKKLVGVALKVFVFVVQKRLTEV